jgi:nucleotide-binding universal stress UspA family protein
MFRKILLLITPSGMCEYAADLAVSLAEQHQANLFVLCMMQSVQSCWDSLFDRPAPKDAEERGLQMAAYFRGRLGPTSRCSVETSCGFSDVEAQRFAWRMDADLILAGFDPRAAQDEEPGRMAQTDLLARLCQGARCPVLIVSKPVKHLPPVFRTVLAATDFSRESDHAVQFASSFAKAAGAKMRLLHVIDATAPPTPDTVEDLRRSLRARLRRDNPDLEIDDVDIRAGRPREVIVDMAASLDADLVVIAHRRKEVDREQIDADSVLAYVAQYAACPTVSVNREIRA